MSHKFATTNRRASCDGALMDEFASHFCRNGDGSWTCVAPATLNSPKGRIQVTAGSRFYPGTMFMGFDLAAWLDERLAGRATRCA